MNEWQNKKEREKDETIDSSIQMSFYYNFFLVKRRKRSSIVLFSFKNWYLMWGFIHKKMCKWSKRRQSTSRDKSMDVRIIIDCWNQILKCYKFSTLTKQKKKQNVNRQAEWLLGVIPIAFFHSFLTIVKI